MLLIELFIYIIVAIPFFTSIIKTVLDNHYVLYIINTSKFLLCCVLFLFIDSLRETVITNNAYELHKYDNGQLNIQMHMKLFRAERNVYLTSMVLYIAL